MTKWSLNYPRPGVIQVVRTTGLEGRVTVLTMHNDLTIERHLTDLVRDATAGEVAIARGLVRESTESQTTNLKNGA